MRSPPRFMRGFCKSVLRFALQKASAAKSTGDETATLQSMDFVSAGSANVALQKSPRRTDPKEPVDRQIHTIHQGRLDQPSDCESGRSRRSCGRRVVDVARKTIQSNEGQSERAQALVAMGEISSGRAALEGAPIAPGNQATLDSLREESRRPPTLREPLPNHLLQRQPKARFDLDRDKFLKNLRCSRRGAAAGPTGMTAEHLRPLLDSAKDSELLWALAQSFCSEWRSSSRNSSLSSARENHSSPQTFGTNSRHSGRGYISAVGCTHHRAANQPCRGEGDSTVPVRSDHESWSGVRRPCDPDVNRP